MQWATNKLNEERNRNLNVLQEDHSQFEDSEKYCIHEYSIREGKCLEQIDLIQAK